MVYTGLLKCHTDMGNKCALLSHVTLYLYVKHTGAGQAVLSRKLWANQLETSTLYCEGDKNKKASLVGRVVVHYQLGCGSLSVGLWLTISRAVAHYQ